MSIHSAVDGKNLNQENSHHNNLNPSMEAHSVAVQHPNASPEHQEWVAAYIDGQYFLTDPESMRRLKDIETEIENQKNKLAKLENDNNELSHSFLSLQEEKDEKKSSRSFCNTEFNENKQINKEEKVKDELEREEDKYRDKIKRMEKERSLVKKGMTPKPKEEVQSKRTDKKSEKLQSHKEQQEGQTPASIKKSVKESSRKSIRESSKQKSYRQSRIQKSIRQNLEMGNLQTEANPILLAKPIEKQKSIISHSTVKKSEEEPLESANIDDKVNSEIKSVRQSAKNEQINEATPSSRVHSIRQGSKKSASVKKSQLLDEQKVQDEVLSKRGSVRASNKTGNPKEVDSSKQYNVNINAIYSVHSSRIYPPSSKAGNDELKEEELISLKESVKDKQSLSKKGDSVVEASPAEAEVKQESNRSRKTSKQNESVKSKKSSHHEEEVKSKYSNLILYDDSKSRKSHTKSNIAPLNEQKKSQKSHVSKHEEAKSVRLEQEEIKSKKSSLHPSVHKDDAKSKKSSLHPSVQNEDIKSKNSSKLEKPLEENSQKSSRTRSIKKEASQISAKDSTSKKHQAIQQIRSQKASVSEKEQSSKSKNMQRPSPIQTAQLNDKSCQYSRVTDPIQSSRAQEEPFQSISQKNNSLIQHNQQSVNESSSFKNMINNELKEEEAQQIEETPAGSPFIKKKREPSAKDNQSQKKSRSFIIHSRNGSVKERTQKPYEQNLGNYSERKSSNADVESPSAYTGSVTKEELFKLHEQITFLRQKLKRVEDKQDLMEKGENNASKVKQHQHSRQEESELPPLVLESSLPNISELSPGLRPQHKLQLQSSIIQVDTSQDLRKKNEKDGELQEKSKLKDEINRLRKIIRDMQIEKIKSIDADNQLGESILLKKDSKQYSNNGSRVEKEREPSNNEGMVTQKKWLGKSRFDEVGRIIKNGDLDKNSMSPRKRSHQIKFHSNEEEVVMEAEELPYESAKKGPYQFINEAKHNSLIDRIQNKDGDFHNFMESSRALVEEGNKSHPRDHPIQESSTNPFKQFSKISVISPGQLPETGSKINYSRLVEEFKKVNPEQDEVLPQIHLRDLKIEEIPNTPTAEMNQDDLLSLAKRTYSVFGVDVDQEDKQLCVKKYKNCVVFTITSNTAECILWHFSGKFYMGGWKAGQPGQGEKHGEGLQIIPDKYIYKGQFLNGKKNGTGILKLANGNLYDGQWIEGMKNGRGVYLDAVTRVIYSGEWKEGKKDGQGYLKLSEKEYYYGTFNKSVKEGFGVQIFVNGDKYKGEYKNGKFFGKGKYTWANSSCYEGQFIDGVREGQGSWKSAKNNGDIYIGVYEADKKNGYGRYVWANGCIYEGTFANDVKHGKGRLTYQDGKEVKGVWEEGNLLKTENEKVPYDHEDQPLRRSMKAQSFGHNPSATTRRF